MSPPFGERDRRLVSPTPVLLMVLIIATTGLVYELGMAAVASYVLGDSISQFSLVIGAYLSALGLGAYLSRFVGARLKTTFVDVELATALVGGLSAPALFVAFSLSGAFRLLLYTTVVWVGTLVGLELPLLVRILEKRLELKELIARALTFDYAGALIGSLGFSLFLVPVLGLVHGSIACGVLNALVGLWSTFVLPADDEREARSLASARLRAVAVLGLLALALFEAGPLTALAENASYGGGVGLAQQTRYQRIVLARRDGGLQLYLNGNLQLSELDEHRYHEALVHPALSVAARRQHVLIGGGGDGMAAREVLRWPEVEHVTLVDLDREMTNLSASEPDLSRMNRGALHDARVRVVNDDALVWLAEHAERFDVVILDFPDPTSFSLGKLYTTHFYRSAAAHLSQGGALVVQATSPLFARESYWCVVHSVQAAGLRVRPYHVLVPSFGEWGFVLATQGDVPEPHQLPPGDSRYLNRSTLRAAFVFPPDMSELPTELNRLNNQALVAYYQREWDRWN